MVQDSKTESSYLTVNQAAELMNMKISRIRNLVFSRKIPVIKIGASIRFKKDDLLKWIDSKALLFGGENE